MECNYYVAFTGNLAMLTSGIPRMTSNTYDKHHGHYLRLCTTIRCGMLIYNNIQDAHADAVKLHGCSMVGYAQCFTVCYDGGRKALSVLRVARLTTGYVSRQQRRFSARCNGAKTNRCPSCLTTLCLTTGYVSRQQRRFSARCNESKTNRCPSKLHGVSFASDATAGPTARSPFAGR